MKTGEKEELTLEGHARAVTAVSFSANGERIITASMDNTAIIWESTKGAMLYELKGHERSVSSAAFSRDGALFVTASEDKTIRVWNAKIGEEEMDKSNGDIMFI